MRRKTAWILAAAVAATVMTAGPARAEGIKVAVIDVNKVLNESEAGKTARKKMEGRYEELKKKIESVNEEARKICLLYTSPSPRD